QYDAIFFWQASSLNRGDTTSPGLFTAGEQQAIEEFARAGGGIAASAAAIAAASVEQIASALRARLFRMSSLGVTTVEVKSGYGLDEAGEKKQLDAIIQVARERDVARVVSTYLALHALPRAMADRRTEYVAAAAERVRAFAVQDLMQFVDAYVDENAFTPLEAEAIALAAAEAGVGVRLHAGQFADVGGAQLAARVGAKSADHLEHVSRGDLEAMAASGTRAVLLPLASFTLGDPPPPVSLMRRAGVAMVVASDANPGTAPSESLPLALALAVRAYGMTPEEALLGATREAAFALGLGDRVGIIAPGYEADLVLWDLPHEHAIVQPWGVSKTRAVVFAGQKQTPRQ
ncbi:MAG TPA: amidohydrolase family protein, partial [Methyloceanibacter sp.]|nr:amidohydrolase family protein [Methyloceanibacter sp.]